MKRLHKMVHPLSTEANPLFFQTGSKLVTESSMSVYMIYHLKGFHKYNSLTTCGILNAYGGSYGFDRNGLKTKIKPLSKFVIFIHARYSS